VVPPWGINGGLHGGTSSKWLVRAGSDERERIKSKLDNLKVQPGDRIIFITAGSGGWGDPLDRPAEKVLRDVNNDLVSIEAAERDYAVIFTPDGKIDTAATDKLRAARKVERGAPEPFDFGFIPGVHAAAE
jgi:N-methylhydantoinase B